MKRFAPFKPNPFPTVGVEQEFHLINPQSADLEDAYAAVHAALPTDVRRFVTPELKDCRRMYLNWRSMSISITGSCWPET